MGDPIKVPDFASGKLTFSFDGAVVYHSANYASLDGFDVPLYDVMTGAIESLEADGQMMLRIDSPGGELNGMRDLIDSMRGDSAAGVGSVGSRKAWTVPSKSARVARTTRKHLPKRIQGRLRSLKQRGRR